MSNETWKCPNCGIENDSENAFCGECGSKKPEMEIGMAGKAVPKSKDLPKSGKENCEINQKQSGAELSKPKKKKGSPFKKKIFISLIVLIFLGIPAYFVGVAINYDISLENAITGELADLFKWGLYHKIVNKKGPVSGLYWSYPSSQDMDWQSAVDYCKNLNEDGYSNWRLPNINELRTLLKNCPKNESYGVCAEIIRDPDRLEEPNYYNYPKECSSSCHCNFSGFYSKFGEIGDFWSSSVVSDDKGKAFYMNFSFAVSGSSVKSGRESYRYVRCVR